MNKNGKMGMVNLVFNMTNYYASFGLSDIDILEGCLGEKLFC